MEGKGRQLGRCRATPDSSAVGASAGILEQEQVLQFSLSESSSRSSVADTCKAIDNMRQEIQSHVRMVKLEMK